MMLQLERAGLDMDEMRFSKEDIDEARAQSDPQPRA
jgi:hypothetical protein